MVSGAVSMTGGGRITSSVMGLFVARLLERGGGYSSECSDSVFDKSWSGHVVPLP